MSVALFRQLPKVELHAHLNGSLSKTTIERLVELKIRQSAGTFNGLSNEEKNVIVMQTPKTLTEYVKTVTSAIKAYKGSMVTRLLLSIDRRFSENEAEEAVDLAISDDSGVIVGIDLSGDPSVDGRKFIPTLRKARHAGLRISVHLAEDKGMLDEVDAFLDFRPDRIGHGTFLHERPAWVASVTAAKIPLEICLTSNVFCKTTPTVADSHFAQWYAQGQPLAICTDDKGLLPGCSLSSEFSLAASTFDLTLAQCREISRVSLETSFLDHSSPEFTKLLHKITTSECTHKLQ